MKTRLMVSSLAVALSATFTVLAPLAQAATVPATVEANAASPQKAPVTSVTVGGKKLLADRNQLTAYVFDVDAPGVSKCYDSCAKAWPAILLKAGEAAPAPFGITVRKDGTKQLTLNNRPLYLYVDDGQPGDTNGDGLGGVWHIVPAPASDL